MKTFEAKFASQCLHCPAGIEPGDEVIYNLTGDVVHVDCQSESSVAEPPAKPVCEKCWTVLSTSGACACF